MLLRSTRTFKFVRILFEHVQEWCAGSERTIRCLDRGGQVLGDQVVRSNVRRLPTTFVHPTIKPVDIAIRSAHGRHVHWFQFQSAVQPRGNTRNPDSQVAPIGPHEDKTLMMPCGKMDIAP